jgi:hypothetical protein
MKEEFGILDPWDEYGRWWWRQYGNDPIWGSYFPEDENNSEQRKQKHTVKARMLKDRE